MMTNVATSSYVLYDAFTWKNDYEVGLVGGGGSGGGKTWRQRIQGGFRR